MKYNQSEKLLKQIEEAKLKPLSIGEMVYIDKIENHKSVTIIKMSAAGIIVKWGREEVPVLFSEHPLDTIIRRDVVRAGANPFISDSYLNYIRSINFSLESILFNLNVLGDNNRVELYNIEGVPINQLNWNPFIIVNGVKKSYQREYVWTLEDKQLLIDSIYNNVGCGAIITRKRSFDELRKMQALGETELFFYDIVDGKQRLNTIKEFMSDEFQDGYGNYFSDLSIIAKGKLTNNQLIRYFEIEEDSPDEFVLQQFLKVNVTGVVQSKQHMEYIKELYTKM